MTATLASRGITFPPPWGLVLNYVFIDQPVEPSAIEIAVEHSEFIVLEDLIDFGEINSRIHGMNARVDLCFLPSSTSTPWATRASTHNQR